MTAPNNPSNDPLTDPTTPIPSKAIQLLTGGASLTGIGTMLIGLLTQLINGNQPGGAAAEWSGAILAAAGIAGWVMHHSKVGEQFLAWLTTDAGKLGLNRLQASQSGNQAGLPPGPSTPGSSSVVEPVNPGQFPA